MVHDFYRRFLQNAIFVMNIVPFPINGGCVAIIVSPPRHSILSICPFTVIYLPR